MPIRLINSCIIIIGKNMFYIATINKHHHHHKERGTSLYRFSIKHVTTHDHGDHVKSSWLRKPADERHPPKPDDIGSNIDKAARQGVNNHIHSLVAC